MRQTLQRLHIFSLAHGVQLHVYAQQKAMMRMTRIYSVAFPLTYDFARNYFSD